MLKTERDKKICARYSAWDETGHVHCEECPLMIDKREIMCKGNSHYDRHLREWVPDETEDNG